MINKDFIETIQLKNISIVYIKKELNYIKAETGEDCLEIFKKRNEILNLDNIHIILMDGNLSIMTGYEAAILIKKMIS